MMNGFFLFGVTLKKASPFKAMVRVSPLNFDG
jgi:hypothetical protein